MKISVSGLRMYSECPRKWYYSFFTSIPKKTNYHFLCGSGVHRHVACLHKKPAQPRKFFFKSKKSAIAAWFNRWQRALKDAKEQKKLVFIDEDKEKKYGQVGAICIANYWNDNVRKPDPLEIESYYQTRLKGGILLRGRFDQVRRVPLGYIESHRPELIKKGALDSRYQATVIVDIKTGYPGYGYYQPEDNLPLMEKVRLQYSLHEDFQATLYCYLYEKTTGKKPIGFIWYYLRNRKTFFTYRKEKDYEVLLDAIHHFRENVQNHSFPKNPSNRCKYCDFLKACREDRCFLMVEPEELFQGSAEIEEIPNTVKKENYLQLRLKLKIPRKKKKSKFPRPQRDDNIILKNLPWDQK